MGLTSLEFAVWSGIAIHDTSSVVGAAMAFDPRILVEATTIKLARAVWIAPDIVLLHHHRKPGPKKVCRALVYMGIFG